jgi:hypothetical protein
MLKTNHKRGTTIGRRCHEEGRGREHPPPSPVRPTTEIAIRGCHHDNPEDTRGATNSSPREQQEAKRTHSFNHGEVEEARRSYINAVLTIAEEEEE